MHVVYTCPELKDSEYNSRAMVMLWRWRDLLCNFGLRNRIISYIVRRLRDHAHCHADHYYVAIIVIWCASC